MGKGRKRVLSDSEIEAIVEAFTINDRLTKREVAYRYKVSVSTIYNILPKYLKNANFPHKKNNKQVCNTGG